MNAGFLVDCGSQFRAHFTKVKLFPQRFVGNGSFHEIQYLLQIPIVYFNRFTVSPVVNLVLIIFTKTIFRTLPLHHFGGVTGLLFRPLGQDLHKASVPQILQALQVVIHAVLHFPKGGAFFMPAGQVLEDLLHLLREVLKEYTGPTLRSIF